MVSPKASDRHRLPGPRLALFAGAFLILFAVVTTGLVIDNADRVRWVEHTLLVEREVSDAQVIMFGAEAGARGFVFNDNPGLLSNFVGADGALSAKLKDISSLISDNPQQRAELRIVQQHGAARMAVLARAVALKHARSDAEALHRLTDPLSVREVSLFHEATDAMRAEENQLYVVRLRQAADSRLALLVLSILTGLATLAFTVIWMSNAWRSTQALQAAYADLISANTQLKAEIEGRAAAEGQIRQLQKMEAIGQLTGGIAHDFNNMLAVIIGNLNLIERRLANGRNDIESYVAAALEGAARAAALTARLLAFSRQQPLAPQPVDLNRLVVRQSEILRRVLGETIMIETVQGGGLWRAQVDPVQLESAILNLAVNARDAMGGEGKLTIETANTYFDQGYAQANGVAAGQYVMIAVSDTGLGMTQDVADRAFDPFFTTKPAGQGTGLGLSQVYGFVKQTHGHVKIYSEPNHGTTVKIYLPRLMADHAAESEVSQPIPARLVGKSEEIVMVVEDEDRVRQFAVEALRELGYTVLHASCARDALHKLQIQPRISLLLTDIVMPEMNGRQLADEAVQMIPNLPVLYMTGFSRNAVVHNGMLDPGVNFLAKPFTLDQLGAKVREVLDAAA